uniref:DUF7903 domain-containing protein n=1 Tax=Fagus sylvatica TaxID=28930 RepID=A0A2N9J3X0_FAGSY
MPEWVVGEFSKLRSDPPGNIPRGGQAHKVINVSPRRGGGQVSHQAFSTHQEGSSEPVPKRSLSTHSSSIQNNPDNNQFPSSVHVDHVSLESIGRKTEGKPLALFNNNKSHSDEEMKRPWEVIAENAVVDLVSCFENVRDEKLEGVKPMLVARFGKILFSESPSISQETRKVFLAAETTLSQLKRSFYTNVPNSYMENVLGEVAQKIEVDFEEEKDLYHVKTELNQVRHMVVDVSCLDKNVDLRLMLSTKRVLTALTDDEMQSIRSLINSAILDQDVKGGLRWPFGKASSGDRYCVVGVWHTIAKSYKSRSLRLKVRHADRFDFRTSNGEATREITLKLKNVVSLLQEKKVENSLVSEMLKDNLRLIWDHFLCCEHFFEAAKI